MSAPHGYGKIPTLIHHAVDHVVKELDAYLQLRSAGNANRVAAGNLVGQDGTVPTALDKKVVVSLVNIEQDAVYHNVETFKKQPDGVSELVRPEMKVNLYFLFIANFSAYDEALKAISNVASFFHQHGSFAYSDVPNLQDQPGRFTFELYSTSFEKMNHLWGSLGAKYMPSILYRVGLVDLRDTQVEALVPPVKGLLINE